MSHWFCAQIGAREHYAIPRALQLAGRSLKLYTDFWAGPAVRKLSLGKLRPLGIRSHSDLENKDSTVVKSWNLRALFWEKRLRDIAASRTPYHGFIEVGHRFATRVREDLARNAHLRSDSIFFAYDTGALETMEWCRSRGVRCVLNQMDPNRTEAGLVRAEEELWPGWTQRKLQVPEEYFARREQEWLLADRIVVNSEFSRRSLIQQGVSAAKLMVIPLCYESAEHHIKPEVKKRDSNQPLRVLFLGQVILRKGIQYLLAAARQLERENIHFDVVGPVGISGEALATAPANVIFHGRTARDQASVWYQKSHLFVLPTVSDGFAITQLEAMAHGLPVVVTACCGDAVNDGVEGFVVPARDVAALVQAFHRYLSEPGLLSAQSAAVLQKAGQFTLNRLAANLTRLEEGLNHR